MNVNRLISYLLSEHLEEKIRTKPGAPTFRMNEFTKLNTIEEIHSYAASRLKYLGRGSSRSVYLLSSRYALKIAGIVRDQYRPKKISGYDKGIGQNRAEIVISENPLVKDIVAHVHQIGPNSNWIVADLVRPIKYYEFMKLTGIDDGDLKTIADAAENFIDVDSKVEDSWRYSEETIDAAKTPFMRAIVAAITKLKLLPGDIVTTHFGKTPDGRAVLYDYGYTRWVSDLYY